MVDAGMMGSWGLWEFNYRPKTWCRTGWLFWNWLLSRQPWNTNTEMKSNQTWLFLYLSVLTESSRQRASEDRWWNHQTEPVPRSPRGGGPRGEAGCLTGDSHRPVPKGHRVALTHTGFAIGMKCELHVAAAFGPLVCVFTDVLATPVAIVTCHCQGE